MTIYVEKDPTADGRRGDWIVKNGAGRGGRIISRHRTKGQAIKRARREADKRGVAWREQMSGGTWRSH